MTMQIDAANQRRIDIILSGQEALIGAVTPNLRVVQVTWNENTIFLYFIYDGAFAKEDEEESDRTAAKMQQDFSDNLVQANCLRVDYPEDFPTHPGENCTWLYARKEKCL